MTALYPPSTGGIQSLVQSMARRFARAGRRVIVITRSFGGAVSEVDPDGVDVRRVGCEVGPGPLRSAAFISAATKLLVELAPELEVIHGHQLLSPALVGGIATALRDVPFVLTPHASGT